MLDDREISSQIEEIVAPLAKALQLELVEVTCRGRGPAAVIRVTIDKPGGVGLDDCERLHHSLSRALMVIGPLAEAYRIEVSSPGLDRPLRTREEFQKAVGKMIRMKLREPVDGHSVLMGRMMRVEEDGVVMALRAQKRDHVVRVAWDRIRATRLEPEW
ncbi:MAG: ribosome maturation factor RimP [Nitrospirae bacterium]|nr:MAG: ribosome maturation factor RimP [Nitrospirota bacterium]